MSTLRVRQILENMDTSKRSELKKLLPIRTTPPELNTSKYPSSLLSNLPTEESYSILGFVAEELLRLPVNDINEQNLVSITRRLCPSFTADKEAKVLASVTTKPFLDCIRVTRRGLEKVLRKEDGDLVFEERVVSGSVEGHPDMRNKTQVFEVKLTGMLEKNWIAFLLQVFAYGALIPEATDLYLVLPLQKTVFHIDIRDWDERKDFLACLTSWSSNQQTTGLENAMMASLLCTSFRIGFHAKKQKTLESTILSLGDYSKPYQIFLGGPITAKVTISDAELAKARKAMDMTKATIFVHSPYIVNLSIVEDEKDKWQTTLLQKNLTYTATFGGSGVVVHVGKFKKEDPKLAIERMRTAIQNVLQYATAASPFLLETPAGQGTELLTDMKEFLDFVDSFKDPRIGICVDTCHVFASGHNPLEYIKAALKYSGLLKLVHFNDSQDKCGSCKDRHASIGTGHIGFQAMQEIAALCATNKIPMVVE